MATPVLVPATVPGDAALPSSAQKLVNFVASYLGISGLTGLAGIIVADSEPAVDDQDKAWLKIDPGSGRAIGLFYYSGGWQAVPVVPHSGENEPADPRPGELFYNTTESALKAYLDGAWTTELWAKGDTGDRPENVPVGFVYFDTDIKRLLRYTAQGWSTVDGAIGEVRIFDGISTSEAEDRNPGWSIMASMAGRVPVGQGDDYPVGKDGGRDTLLWSAVGNAAQGGNREQGLVKSLTLDGTTFTPSSGNSSDSSKDGEINIMPPYRSVIFMRKDY